jgi:hypothetical protein
LQRPPAIAHHFVDAVDRFLQVLTRHLGVDLNLRFFRRRGYRAFCLRSLGGCGLWSLRDLGYRPSRDWLNSSRGTWLYG